MKKKTRQQMKTPESFATRVFFRKNIWGMNQCSGSRVNWSPQSGCIRNIRILIVWSKVQRNSRTKVPFPYFISCRDFLFFWQPIFYGSVINWPPGYGFPYTWITDPWIRIQIFTDPDHWFEPSFLSVLHFVIFSCPLGWKCVHALEILFFLVGLKEQVKNKREKIWIWVWIIYKKTTEIV